MVNKLKLSNIDKKLFAQMYHNSREPATKIGKTLHLSREQVAYRIKKFEKEGVIKGYLPIINYSRLGYHKRCILFFKFNKRSQIENFKNELSKSPFRITTVELLSKFDLAMLFVFRDEKERNECVSNILQKYAEEIRTYQILEPYFSESYPLKFLGIAKSSSNILHEYSREDYQLDEKEEKILSVLADNANAQIIEIAKKTGISAELIVYKLKKLREGNVLISTRAYFDMQKIGYSYYLIMIDLLDLSGKNMEKIKEFAQQNNFVDSLNLFLGSPNAYIQIFYKEQSELHSILEGLKEKFDAIPSIEVIPLKNEGEDINPLPFLKSKGRIFSRLSRNIQLFI